MAEQHIEDLCEERARNGDGSFAIAYALLRLVDAQERTAKELQSLGMGNASTGMGAIEGLTMSIDRIAEALAIRD